MFKAIITGKATKSSFRLSVLALILGGVGAQASGVLNSPSGGYLVCVNSKTRVVTHPGTTNCSKGSDKLVLGAQGAAGLDGLAGAAGIAGKDGLNGKDGNTLWNGVTDPENTLGAPGDMFINSVTKTLFGPKNLDGTWPTGVPMVGPKGDQGPAGLTGATGPQGPGGSGPAGPQGPAGAAGANGIAAPITTGTNCILTKCTYKIGETGPGGGIIFFVDYNDQYSGFDYLEAAPKSCEAQKAWSSDTTHSLVAVNGFAAWAVGSGKTNTTAMLANGATSYIGDTSGAAFYSDALASGVPAGCVTSKDDWFLGSLGEMRLMFENLYGVIEFVGGGYFSSTQYNATSGYYQYFGASGGQGSNPKSATTIYVRPIRSF